MSGIDILHSGIIIWSSSSISIGTSWASCFWQVWAGNALCFVKSVGGFFCRYEQTMLFAAGGKPVGGFFWQEWSGNALWQVWAVAAPCFSEILFDNQLGKFLLASVSIATPCFCLWKKAQRASWQVWAVAVPCFCLWNSSASLQVWAVAAPCFCC